jgi:hypothetical protein
MFEARVGETRVGRRLVEALDAAQTRVGQAHRELLSMIAEVERLEAWRDSGARDAAHWLAMRYGISEWKARRWIAAAHALERLPRLSEALAGGELGIDKVVELARFVTVQDEADLIGWAKWVSCAAVRRRGDLAARASREEVIEAERSRSVSWWYLDEGRRFGLEAELPAAQGAVVARALERLAESMPRCRTRRTSASLLPGGPTPWWPCAPLGSPRTPIRTARP